MFRSAFWSRQNLPAILFVFLVSLECIYPAAIIYFLFDSGKLREIRALSCCFFSSPQLFGGLWGRWQSCASNIITPFAITVHFPAWALYLKRGSKGFIWENVLSSSLSYHCSVRSNHSIKEMLLCYWGQFLNSKNSVFPPTDLFWIFYSNNHFYCSKKPALKRFVGKTILHFYSSLLKFCNAGTYIYKLLWIFFL